MAGSLCFIGDEVFKGLKMNGKNKGSDFERVICRQLSVWWTGNPDTDDIFWRTSSSGGRASSRSKKGKKDFGGAGDIHAENPIGQPLLDVCTIEVKKGYNAETLMNILDKAPTAAEQLYEKIIKQAKQSARDSKSLSWMIISKRDMHPTIVVIPQHFYLVLKQHGMKSVGTPRMLLEFTAATGENEKIICAQFEDFLRHVTPDIIKGVAQERITLWGYEPAPNEETTIGRCPNCDEMSLRMATHRWSCQNPNCNYSESR